MGLFSTIGIAASGMSAERLRSDVIADNIANASTTRTQEGGAFRRSRVIMAPRTSSTYWRLPFKMPLSDEGKGRGVRVVEVQKDMTEGRLVYDPSHPDRIMDGPNKDYVRYPNVNIVTEMVDLIAAQRAYEANSAMVAGSKAMFLKALEIGRG
jgi:flagellar basal-body rod protein FlgC